MCSVVLLFYSLFYRCNKDYAEIVEDYVTMNTESNYY